MKYLELTFPDPASNLACDEALLEGLEQTPSNTGILRIWEPRSHFVVLGYANKVITEVDPGACKTRGVPILRRSSGGGAVLQGPGCLNYSLILPNDRSEFESISGSYRFILERHRRFMEPLLGTPVQIQGISDLAVDGKKFSGNAQNRKRRFLLFHGTLLLDLDLALVEACLRMPSKQPQYRKGRGHRDFLLNIRLERQEVSERLKDTWQAQERFVDVPITRIDELVRARYGCQAWTHRF
jgi:lipoate-protein ligase A